MNTTDHRTSIQENIAIVTAQLAVAEEALIWLADADSDTIAKVTAVRDNLEASLADHKREHHQNEVDRLRALVSGGNTSGLVKLRLKMHLGALDDLA